jgi:hypothetical protein
MLRPKKSCRQDLLNYFDLGSQFVNAAALRFPGDLVWHEGLLQGMFFFKPDNGASLSMISCFSFTSFGRHNYGIQKNQ